MGSQVSAHNNPAHGSGIPGVNPNSSTDYFVADGHSDELPAPDSPNAEAPKIAKGTGRKGIGPTMALPTEVGGFSRDDSRVINKPESDTVTCVFTWTHGGHTVFLAGSFTEWSTEKKIPLVKAGHEFVTVQELKRGRHLYKFIVDDVWKYAPDQETATDENGFVNNIIDVTEHKRFDYRISCDLAQMRRSHFHQYIPDAAEYTSDAPQIPVLFSKTACPASDPPPRMTAPLHSVANHLYHDTLAPNIFGPHISVVATTHRWRGGDRFNVLTQKHCTSVLVTLNPLFLAAAPHAVHEYAPPDALRELITKQFLKRMGNQTSSASK